MPPAFNLSQDQTLQLILIAADTFTLKVNEVYFSWTACCFGRHGKKAPVRDAFNQAPTLIGCEFLKSEHPKVL
jgi:hypothetical protein